MRFFKRLAVVMMAAALFAAPAAAGEIKIGYANLQKALNESEAGLKAKDDLKVADQKLEEEFKTKQEDLKKMKEEIDKKGIAWNKETREKKETEFKARVQEFQKGFMQKGDELNKKKSEAEAKIITDLRDVVSSFAKEKSYTYIFEGSVGVILHAPADADITNEIIKAYNAKRRK
ncbi:MAG: OmpH family outer membrane protein [Deltaproteobacteria bacterium]